MTKTADSTFSPPAMGEVLPLKPVLSSTWREIVAAQHYVYGRQGGHFMNVVFDPPWQSLDFGSGGSAYHSVGTAVQGGMSLDQATGLFRFERKEYNTTATDQGYRASLNVYARNLNVRATLVRLDTEDGHTGSTTSFTGLVTSHAAGNSEWAVDTLEFTPAQASRSGSTANGLAYFLVYIEALVPASGSGYIGHVGLRETPITAANNLPRGA